MDNIPPSRQVLQHGFARHDLLRLLEEFWTLRELFTVLCAGQATRAGAMHVLQYRWDRARCHWNFKFPAACSSLLEKYRHVCHPRFRLLGRNPVVARDRLGNRFLTHDHIYTFELDMAAGVHDFSFRASSILGDGAMHIGVRPSSLLDDDSYQGPSNVFLEQFQEAACAFSCASTWFIDLLLRHQVDMLSPTTVQTGDNILNVCTAFRDSWRSFHRIEELPRGLETKIARRCCVRTCGESTLMPSNRNDCVALQALVDITKQHLVILDAVSGKPLVTTSEACQRRGHHVFLARTGVGDFRGLSPKKRPRDAVPLKSASSASFDILRLYHSGPFNGDIALDIRFDASAGRLTLRDSVIGACCESSLSVLALPYRWFVYLAEPDVFGYGRFSMQCRTSTQLQHVSRSGYA